MLFFLAIFIGLFILLELPGLLKARTHKDLIIAAILLVFSTAYGLDLHLQRNILPNPNQIFFLAEPLAESFRDFRK